MTKIFLSYAREDREVARTLAELLEKRGHDVWWDRELLGGQDFRAAIREQLETSEKVIVLWSDHSSNSDFVIDEARIARENGKLRPIAIENTRIPMGFGSLHTLQIWDWAAEIDRIDSFVNDKPFRQSGIGWRGIWRRSMPILMGLVVLMVGYLVLADEGVQNLREWVDRRINTLQGKVEASTWVEAGGSTYYLRARGRRRRLFFFSPSAAAKQAGANKYQLFFRGVSREKRYGGKVFMAPIPCPNQTYEVEGPILDRGSRFVLEGLEPVLDENCQKTGERPVSLKFRLLPGGKKWVQWK